MIQALKESIEKPGILGTKARAQRDAVGQIIEWINSNIYYSQSQKTHDLYKNFAEAHQGDPKASILNLLLQSKLGDCDVHNALAIHIFTHELGIPARLPAGFVGMDGKVSRKSGHGWTEYWIPEMGGWITGDATSHNEDPDSPKVIVKGPGRGDKREPYEKVKDLPPSIEDQLKIYRCVKDYVLDQVRKSGDLTVLQENTPLEDIYKAFCQNVKLRPPFYTSSMIEIQLRMLARSIHNEINEHNEKIGRPKIPPQEGLQADLLKFEMNLLEIPGLDLSKTDVPSLMATIEHGIKDMAFPKPLVMQFLNLLPPLAEKQKLSKREIPKWLSEITAFTNSMIQGAPTKQEVWSKVPPILRVYLKQQGNGSNLSRDTRKAELHEWADFWWFFLYKDTDKINKNNSFAVFNPGNITEDSIPEVKEVTKLAEEGTIALLKQTKKEHAKLGLAEGLGIVEKIIPDEFSLATGDAVPRYAPFRPRVSRTITNLFHEQITRNITETGHLPFNLHFLIPDAPDSFAFDAIQALIDVAPEKALILEKKGGNTTEFSDLKFLDLKSDLKFTVNNLNQGELIALINHLDQKIATLHYDAPTPANPQWSHALDRIHLQKVLAEALLERDLPLTKASLPALSFLAKTALPNGGPEDQAAFSLWGGWLSCNPSLPVRDALWRVSRNALWKWSQRLSPDPRTGLQLALAERDPV